jgi:hypothetical protein
MTAGYYDFIFEQGATFSKTFIYKDSNEAVVNLTGYTARMQIRSYKDSPTILLSATTENGKIVITPALGKIVASFTAAEASIGKIGKAVYDLEIVSPAGAVTRLVEGAITNSLEVTR